MLKVTSVELEAREERTEERGPHDADVVVVDGVAEIRCRYWVCGAPVTVVLEQDPAMPETSIGVGTCSCCGAATSARTAGGVLLDAQLVRRSVSVRHLSVAEAVDRCLREVVPGAVVRQRLVAECPSCKRPEFVLMLDGIDLDASPTALYDGRCRSCRASLEWTARITSPEG